MPQNVAHSTPRRLPPWLRKRLTSSACYVSTADTIESLGVNTVCREAKCPNLNECFSAGTATFMIMGDRCTRHCAFCAVGGAAQPVPLNASEPQRIAQAIQRMSLKYAVITSVTRDDLPDGGAEHFFKTIHAVMDLNPSCRVEALTSDFAGRRESVELVCSARPSVYNHNLETVERLTPRIRSGADYRRSLEVLSWAKQAKAGLYTKSGLMVGLGETDAEITEAMHDLRSVDCDILTIGQYLSPTAEHLAVDRYVEPRIFEDYERTARSLGFLAVASGPFIRSSYKAAELIEP
ncbi:MAG: lipoyl synthase [Actinobacteria bacterium]|nr:lipoyl synthase [Actinomycetota bacterium]